MRLWLFWILWCFSHTIYRTYVKSQILHPLYEWKGTSNKLVLWRLTDEGSFILLGYSTNQYCNLRTSYSTEPSLMWWSLPMMNNHVTSQDMRHNTQCMWGPQHRGVTRIRTYNYFKQIVYCSIMCIGKIVGSKSISYKQAAWNNMITAKLNCQ